MTQTNINISLTHATFKTNILKYSEAVNWYKNKNL